MRIETWEVVVRFINTVEQRILAATGEKVLRLDKIREYEDLTEWFRQQKIISDKEAAGLNKLSRSQPVEAESVRRRGIELREALFEVCAALISNHSLPVAPLTILNRELIQSTVNYQLVGKGKKVKMEWVNGENALDLMLWRIIQIAADFLSAGNFSRLRKCAEENCQKIFIDASRGGRRQWCDMRSCGNRAKIRRFRAKQKS